MGNQSVQDFCEGVCVCVCAQIGVCGLTLPFFFYHLVPSSSLGTFFPFKRVVFGCLFYSVRHRCLVTFVSVSASCQPQTKNVALFKLKQKRCSRGEGVGAGHEAETNP